MDADNGRPAIDKARDDQQILEHGGLRATVRLAAGTPMAQEVVVGELAFGERHALTEQVDAKMRQLQQLVGPSGRHPGLLALLWRIIFGYKPPDHAGQVRRLLEEMDERDVKFLAACVLPFNRGLTEDALRRLLMASTPSQVRVMVREAYRVNHLAEDTDRPLAPAGAPSADAPEQSPSS